MEKNKTLKYIDIKSSLRNIAILMLIILCPLMFIGKIDKETLILIVLFIIFMLWKIFSARFYHLYKFILKDNKIKIQSYKGLKICNIDTDVKNIQNFQIDINVSYKRFFAGMFDITIKVDLCNGQSYETKHCTNTPDFVQFIAKLLKEIPNLKICVNSDLNKGEYSKENIEQYLLNEKYSNNNKRSIHDYIGVIIVFAIMILAFITMFFQ